MYFSYFIIVSEQGQIVNISVNICLQYTAVTLQVNKSMEDMQSRLHCFVLYSSKQHYYSKSKARVIRRSQKCPTSQIILLPTTRMLSGFTGSTQHLWDNSYCRD